MSYVYGVGVEIEVVSRKCAVCTKMARASMPWPQTPLQADMFRRLCENINGSTRSQAPRVFDKSWVLFEKQKGMDDQCVVLIQSPLELVCDMWVIICQAYIFYWSIHSVISAAIIAVYVPQLRYPSLKNIEGSASNVTATLLHALFATDQLSNALIAHWFVLPCVTSGLVKGINAVRLFLGLAQATIIFICAAHLYVPHYYLHSPL